MNISKRPTVKVPLLIALVLCLLTMSGLRAVEPSAAAADANAAQPCNPDSYTTRSSAQQAVRWANPSWRVCVGGTITQSSPAVFTWNGSTDLAVGDESGDLHLLDASSGKELPGWPRRMAGPVGASIAIESSPTVAFLDGKSKPPSIIVGSASTWVGSTIGEVEGFNFSGLARFVFHVGKAAGTAVGVISTPAVGDVLGDGRSQIVFGSWDHKIYVLNSSGQQLGFAYDNADTIWSSPTLFKVRGQSGEDIILGSDASGRPTPGIPGGKCKGGFVSEYRWSGSALDPDTLKVGAGLNRVWFDCLNQSVWSSSSMATVRNRPAVFVGTGFFEQPFPSDTNKVFAFYASDGTRVPGWPVTTPGPVVGSPAIGTIGHKLKGVVVTSFICNGSAESSCFSSGRSQVTAFSLSGHMIWSRTLPGPTAFGSPILVPLLGETTNDVLVTTPNGLYPLSGRSGAMLFNTNASNQFAAVNPGCRSFSTPAVAQVVAPGAVGDWAVFESCGGPSIQPGRCFAAAQGTSVPRRRH
jgi:hypothetical protein